MKMKKYKLYCTYYPNKEDLTKEKKIIYFVETFDIYNAIYIVKWNINNDFHTDYFIIDNIEEY